MDDLTSQDKIGYRLIVLSEIVQHKRVKTRHTGDCLLKHNTPALHSKSENIIFTIHKHPLNLNTRIGMAIGDRMFKLLMRKGVSMSKTVINFI